MSSDQQDIIKSEIETREADQLFFHAPVALIGHAGAALLCAVLYLQSVPPLYTLGWLAVMLLTLGLRWRVIRQYSTRNRYAPVNNEVQSYQRHVTVTGLLWCVLYLYAAATIPADQFVYLPFIICALLAGTTIVYNCQVRVFLTFASITTVLPSLYLLILAGSEKQVFGLITLMWFGYLSLIAMETRKYLSRSARCEIENLALLSELRRERNRANMMLEQLRRREP